MLGWDRTFLQFICLFHPLGLSHRIRVFIIFLIRASPMYVWRVWSFSLNKSRREYISAVFSFSLININLSRSPAQARPGLTCLVIINIHQQTGEYLCNTGWGWLAKGRYWYSNIVQKNLIRVQTRNWIQNDPSLRLQLCIFIRIKIINIYLLLKSVPVGNMGGYSWASIIV